MVLLLINIEKIIERIISNFDHMRLVMTKKTVAIKSGNIIKNHICFVIFMHDYFIERMNGDVMIVYIREKIYNLEASYLYEKKTIL